MMFNELIMSPINLVKNYTISVINAMLRILDETCVNPCFQNTEIDGAYLVNEN